MELNEFLSNPSFSKYAKNIETIRDEFISEGCEKYLWRNFRTELAAMEYLKKVELTHSNISQNEHVSSFLSQFEHIDPKKQLVFIFPEDFTPFYHVASYITKTADESRIIMNLFPEDDTKNIIAIYNRETCSKRDIGMLFTYSFGMKGMEADTNGGYKLFGRGLLYYYNCLEYQGNMIYTTEFAHFQGNSFRRDTNPYEILEARKYTKMLIRLGYFSDEYELLFNLREYILPLFQQYYGAAKEYLMPDTFSEQRTWRDEISRVKETLILEGTIARKWKSEKSLYEIVKRLYPDARFQYYPDWLEPQSLDIFIPSISVGIEYQGIQHYRPVDFFGGEEAFKHRVELDQRKRDLCKQNHIILIEWKYDTDLTRDNFDRIIHDCCDRNEGMDSNI